MKDETTFQEGQRVKLKADPEEGWPEEFAEVLEYQGTHNDGTGVYMVRVEEAYLMDEFDDGLREVTEDQMEAA